MIYCSWIIATRITTIATAVVPAATTTTIIITTTIAAATITTAAAIGSATTAANVSGSEKESVSGTGTGSCPPRRWSS